jgi:hypothetical protein
MTLEPSDGYCHGFLETLRYIKRDVAMPTVEEGEGGAPVLPPMLTESELVKQNAVVLSSFQL